ALPPLSRSCGHATSPPRVHANVVHQHALRKGCRPVRISREISADGQVQNQEKGMVVHPPRAFRKVRGSPRRVKFIVHIKTNRVGLPFDRENVKIIAEAPLRNGVGAGYRIFGGISRAMDAPVNPGLPNVHVFHDVNFTASWPAGGRKIVSKHPECRPDTLPRRNFYTRLKSPVSLAKKSLRFKAPGSILSRHTVGSREFFLPSFDHKLAILQVK